MIDIARIGAAAVIALIGLGTANAEDAPKAEVEALRQAMAKYEDPYVAVRDLYLSTVGCVHYDGSTMEGHMQLSERCHGHSFR